MELAPASTNATVSASVLLPQAMRCSPRIEYRLGADGVFRRLGDVVGICVAIGAGQQAANVDGAGNREVEVGNPAPSGRRVQAQHALVPSGLLGKTVVGEDVGALLCGRPPAGDDTRHLLEADLERGQAATVAGEDDVVLVDESGSSTPPRMLATIC